MPPREETVCYPLCGIEINVEQLLRDYACVVGEKWTNQNRYRAETTNWKGISVYSISGAADDLRCSDRPNTMKTPVGAMCSYICNDLLPQFDTQPLRVAFYRLSAGTVVGRHKDYGQNRSMGMVRVHIPVVTNDQVVMQVSGERYRFRVGEAWYFDASCWHSVTNAGNEDRVHLIADLMPSTGLDRHLKPISLRDRVRFLRARAESYNAVGHAFLRFVRTAQGRKRIRDRIGVIFGGRTGSRSRKGRSQLRELSRLHESV